MSGSTCMVHLDVDAGNLQSVSLSVLLQLLSGAKQITLKMENADFQCEIITQETPNSTNKISHTFERSRKTVGLLRSNTSHV
jgi:hypothetical protein